MSGTRLLGGWASFTKAWARSWLAEYLLLASTYKINVLDASLWWGIWGLGFFGDFDLFCCILYTRSQADSYSPFSADIDSKQMRTAGSLESNPILLRQRLTTKPSPWAYKYFKGNYIDCCKMDETTTCRIEATLTAWKSSNIHLQTVVEEVFERGCELFPGLDLWPSNLGDQEEGPERRFVQIGRRTFNHFNAHDPERPDVDFFAWKLR